MTRSFPADSKGASCGCEGGAFVPYLAANPALHRLLSRLFRTRLADGIVGWMARLALKTCRGGTIDLERVAERNSVKSGDFSRTNLDAQFFAGIAYTPEGRKKTAQVLRNLETLDFDARVGLLKTWIHASVVTSTSRDAHFLRSESPERRRPLPMDAIVAPFGACNLRCRGCFYLEDLKGESTSAERLDLIIAQLKALDVYHVLLAGKGEPFFDARSKRALFAVARRNPQMFFTVYSNGMNIGEKDLIDLKAHSNILPIISIDGPQPINDWRRGTGVYEKVLDVMRRMRHKGMFFGYISTVFNQNIDAVVDLHFIEHMAGLGCQVGYYSLFVTPPKNVAPGMMLDAGKRTQYFEHIRRLDKAAPIPLVDIDGIEASFGCRARKGATIYVDAITGSVSPCIRAAQASSACNLFQPGESGKLVKILNSTEFRAFRSELPESGSCVAFRQADGSA